MRYIALSSKKLTEKDPNFSSVALHTFYISTTCCLIHVFYEFKLFFPFLVDARSMKHFNLYYNKACFQSGGIEHNFNGIRYKLLMWEQVTLNGFVSEMLAIVCSFFLWLPPLPSKIRFK